MEEGPEKREQADDGAPKTKQFAGQLNVNSSCGAYLFFWMVESESAPAVVGSRLGVVDLRAWSEGR